MPRINYVKKCKKDQGNCGRCRDPLPIGSAYRWIKFRYAGRRVRCMKFSCAFRQSDLTSNDKLSRAYAAGEMVEDALGGFVLEVHVKEILEKGRAIVETVDEAMNELEEVSAEYEESADNMEEYFSGSYQIDEIRDKAYMLEDWRTEFEQGKDALEGSLDELDEYIAAVTKYREEHDIPEGAEIIVTTVEGLMGMVFDEEGNLEPFDTSQVEDAVRQLEDATSSCPI